MNDDSAVKYSNQVYSGNSRQTQRHEEYNKITSGETKIIC